MKKITKTVTSLLLGTSMLLTMSACGDIGKKTDPTTSATTNSNGETQTTTAASTKAQTKIRFSWWGGDDRHAATLEAIKGFEAEYPNIKVDSEYGGWTGWQEKITTQMVGGQETDLLQINWNWIYLFSKNGDGFYDLNKMSNIINLDNYSKDLLDSMSTKGTLNGIPVSVTGRVFIHNDSTYAKAGIDIPKSFDDFYKAAEVFQTKLGPDYYPLAGDSLTSMLLWKYYLEQKYGKEWIVDNKLNYTEAELVDGYNFILDLEAKKVLVSQKAIASGGAADAVFNDPKWMDGHYASTYEWDSAVLKWQEPLSEGKLVLGEFPKDLGPNNSALVKISLGLAISKNTKNAEPAAQLLSYLVENENGVKALKLTRGIVSNKSAVKTLENAQLLSGITYEGNKLVQAFAGYGFDGNFEAVPLRDDLYRALLVQVSYGETTPEAAAAKVIKTVNEYNQKYPLN